MTRRYYHAVGCFGFFFKFQVLVGLSSFIKFLVQKSLGDNLYQTMVVDLYEVQSES